MSASEFSEEDAKTPPCPDVSNYIFQELERKLRIFQAANNLLYEQYLEPMAILQVIADKINNDANFKSKMSATERLQPPPISPPKKKVTKEDFSMIPSDRCGCEFCQHKEELPISSPSDTWYSCNDFGATAIPPQKAEGEKTFSPFRPLGPSRI